MSDLGELFAQAEAEAAEGGEVEGLGGEADQVDNLDTDIEIDVDDTESADVDDGIEDEGGNLDDGADEESSFDWQEYSDQLVPITVAGEEHMVPLKDLRDGFMRQSDYTRKTQEVASVKDAAQWAESVQAAFDADPAGTLKAFAEAYGLLDQADQKQAQNSLEDLDEDVRPFAERALHAEQQVAQIRQQMESIENQRIQDEVRAELRGMVSTYGDAFDPEASLQVAAARNISLEDAHLLLMGHRFLTDQRTQSEAGSAAAKAAEAAAAAKEKARKAAKDTATGASTKSFKASDIPVEDFSDIGELMEQVMASSS